MNNNKEFILFSHVLGINDPWYVQDITTTKGNNKNIINIYISYNINKIIRCPKCNKICTIEKFVKKTWRHIDFFNKKCYVNVDIPKIKCNDDIDMFLNKEFGSMNSDFTFALENKIFINSQFIPVSIISKNLDISDDIIWSILLNRHSDDNNIEYLYDLNNTDIHKNMCCIL